MKALRGQGEKLGASLVFLALYAAYVCYNLNYFYVRGGAGDPAWFAWLSAHSFAWPMQNPANIGGNFAQTHISPIFFISSFCLRPFAAAPDTVKFSFLFSLWLPLFWVAMLLLCRIWQTTWLRRIWLALLFTLNGLNLSMFGFPHIESFIPALSLLGLAAYFQFSKTGYLWALTLFAMALLVREDAGIHLVIVTIALLASTLPRRDRHLQRGLLGLAGLCLGYSLFAFFLQAYFVPGHRSLLAAEYLGVPLFSQITVHGLVSRLIYWMTRRPFIFAPLILMSAAPLLRQADKRAGLGVLIALPWLGLSSIAVLGMIGDLTDYYCFPLVFAFIWPLLLAQILELDRRQPLLRLQGWMAGLSAGFFVLIGVLPFVGDGGSHDKAPWLHLLPPNFSVVFKSETEISAAASNVIMDNGVAALALGEITPFQHRPDEAFSADDLAKAAGYLRFITPPPPFLADKTAMLAAAFPNCTRLAGTYLEMCRKAGS